VDTRISDASRSVEFASFMRAYQDMVFSTIVRITSSDAHAEDLAQEVFLKAYEHFAVLQSSPAAGGWLKTVARNLALNHVMRYRKRWRLFSEFARTEDDEDKLPPQLAVEHSATARLHEEWRHDCIERAVQSLPDHRRLPLVLYHFEEMSYEEIAARLGSTQAKVKVDIHRARVRLAQLLASSGIDARDLE
jgi:RNA polymerase sigma-70 factor, ECF subfamily